MSPDLLRLKLVLHPQAPLSSTGATWAQIASSVSSIFPSGFASVGRKSGYRFKEHMPGRSCDPAGYRPVPTLPQVGGLGEGMSYLVAGQTYADGESDGKLIAWPVYYVVALVAIWR
jgi:hypothetical protein